MSFFVNKYPGPVRNFYKLTGSEELNNDLLITGSQGNQALLARVGQQGGIQWCKNYQLGEEIILFYHQAPASNGEFLVLGRVNLPQNNRIDHLLARIDQQGNPLWAKRLSTDFSRTNTGIRRIGENTYVIGGWYNSSGSQDQVELLKVDGDGNLLVHTVKMALGSDTQLMAMEGTSEELFLGGGTNLHPPLRPFFSRISKDVKRHVTIALLPPTPNSAEDILAIGRMQPEDSPQESILVAGRSWTGNYYKTFLTQLSLTSEENLVLQSISFSLTNGSDYVRKALFVNDFIYILGQHREGLYSYVICLDLNFSILWAKRLDLEGNHVFIDIQPKNGTELWLTGYTWATAGDYQPLLVKTDLQLTTCKTIEMPIPEIAEYPLDISWHPGNLTVEQEVTSDPVELNVSNVPLEVEQLCPDPVFEPDETSWLQSPYLYLQSAGSMGTRASEGTLLRWFFLRNLGDSHLPKGDFSQNTNGFNKPDDYVRIYRAAYDQPHYKELDLQGTAPVYIDDLHRRWVYQTESFRCYLHFLDQDRYDQATIAHDPQTQAWQCIEAYGDALLELELRGQLAFSVVANQDGFNINRSLQLEVFSTQGDLPLEETAITARKSFSLDGPFGPWRIISENIKKVRFRAFGYTVPGFQFELYSDFLSEHSFEPLGSFALTTDTNLAHQRLEDTSRFQVDGLWQKYDEDSPVNSQNYKDRWDHPGGGRELLKKGVEKYLQLSETDPRAIDTIDEEIDGESSMDISYFDMLQIAGLDYHFARVEGMGHIDTFDQNESQKFVYLAEYVTVGLLDSQSSAAPRQHLYLSLPTSKQDERLPEKVETLPLSYGLQLYAGTSQPLAITDPQGYAPYAPIRYINVHGQPLLDFNRSDAFFQPSLEFVSANFSRAVFAGLASRQQGATNWERPSLSHNTDFLDAGTPSVPEAIPLSIPGDATKALFVHEERTEGIREYALSAINIFSIAIAPHNSVFSDYTKFVKPNTLLPPQKVHAQLIQEEDPLLLTTANEQSWLAGFSNQTDKTMVRLTFQYHHIHDTNYDFGDQVEIFFREAMPRNIQGMIAGVADDVDDRYAIINTQAYNFNSRPLTVVPHIDPADSNNFVGGVLVVGDTRYMIEAVIQTTLSGDFPKFKIRKKEDRNSDDLGGGQIVTTQSYQSPTDTVGELFMAIENMAVADNWGNNNPLAFHVQIGDSSWTSKVETVEDPESGTKETTLRGVWDTAMITPKTHNANNDPLPPGFYDIVFDTYQLPHHSQWLDYADSNNLGQNSVDWYGGVLRVPVIADNTGLLEKKVLDVVRIENIGDGQVLRLVVHDEYFQTDAAKSDENIQTGSRISINFYPGYRIYLHQDGSANFTQNHILPASGEGEKKTLLGLRSVDTTALDAGNQPYRSKIGAPQILYALEIIDPVKPKLPVGPAYATPPDLLNNKSSYTYDTELQPTAFGAIFYRAEVNSVLKSLFKKATYKNIKASLPTPDQDEYYANRIRAVVQADYDESTGQFPSFPLGDDSYTFPKPDNTENGFEADANDPDNPTPDPANMKDLIRKAVYKVFVPMTEQPLVYSLINGGDYIPQRKPQTIRDKYGKPLDPTHPDYDLAPMAKRIDGTSKVRFTDFTLDGGMSPDTAYLYCVRELGNRLALSDPSEILGPVRLVNFSPPEAPIVRKFTTQLASEITGAQTAVNFEVNEYSPSQNIKKIQIYRATRAVDALSPRTMQLAKEVDITEEMLLDGIIRIQDDFSDVTTVPYGEPLFYKLVALREVIYEDVDRNKKTSDVPSKPTKTLLANIVDVFNPEPPKIEQTGGTLNNDEIQGLAIKWNKTAHNATYYLFRMNSFGNWNKVTEIYSNDEADLAYTFPYPIPKKDEEENVIYHRLKVTVENSSGLLNLSEDILTI